MIDISFTELMVIAIVGLIVIGPERMPKVARTVGHLLGRLQRYVTDVKSDIHREMQLEDLKKLQMDITGQAHDLQRQFNDQLNRVESDLNHSILPKPEEPPAPPTPPAASSPVLPAAAVPASAAFFPPGVILPTETSSTPVPAPVVSAGASPVPTDTAPRPGA